MQLIVKKKISLLFLLVLLPLVSAVQIDSGTIIQSVGLNTTLNFTSTYYADVIQTESSFIYFQGFRSTSAGTETVTVNMTNRNMTGIPPYISASTSTSKTITSTLSQGVNATVIVNVINCNAYLPVTSTGGYTSKSCLSTNSLALYGVNIDPSGETITLGQSQATPNAFNSTFVLISSGLGAVVSILLIIGTFMMLINGSMPFQTFIRALIIEIVMFFIAGTIVLLAL